MERTIEMTAANLRQKMLADDGVQETTFKIFNAII